MRRLLAVLVVLLPQILYVLQSFILLKSVNGGTSWRNIDFPGTAVDGIAFDPPRNLYVTGRPC